MIFSKLHSLTFFRSITVILRNYNSHNFRPFMMPKDNRLYLNQLQKQRKRIKAQATKYTPSQVYIQVIGPGTRAGCRSILLVTDHTNYLFNCGEGTQRLATEYHAKLTKIEHIFVTKPTWENMGGIPGVALTVQDTGVPTIYLHGPDGSADLMEATENFMSLDELEMLTADTSKEFTDQTMTVTYIQILNPKATKDDDSVNNVNLPLDNINYYDFRVNSNGKRSHSPSSSKKRTIKVRLSDSMSRINSMMVYICKIHPKEGALDIEKCVEAGVTPGPNLKKLKSGEDITLEDGRIVRSTDVVRPADPGPLFIVLECPSEDWIDVIVHNPAFKKYQLATAAKKDEVAQYIVHFTPENILQNTKYKEWMREFGPSTQHLIVNEDNNGYTSEALHKMQHQLHLVHPEIFPIFGDPDLNKENSNESKSLSNMEIDGNEEEILKKLCDNPDSTAELPIPKSENEVKASAVTNDNEPFIHRCKTLNTAHLRPNKGLDTNTEVQIHPKDYVQEVFDVDGFLDVLADLQTELNAKTKALGDIEEYPKLLMLGTGSSVPNKNRNTSGILLQLDEDRSIILDCGEGTMGQLLTFFGKSKIDRVLKSIKAIFVSHLHADHHLGLIGILKQRERVTDEPLFLLAPQQIALFLNFYHNRFEPIVKQFRLVSNRDLVMNQCILAPLVEKDMYELLDVSKISTTFVKHCPFAYGVAITLKDGRKICYSGDTEPCDNMVKLASDSLLLIHEATMEDGLENEAMIKKHSTISQAINIGVKANAKYTLLTHFSQRYSKIPLLPSAEQSNIDFKRVGIAYDFMSVSLSQLSLLSYFYPCLAHMFREFRALLDERALKREQKKEQLVKTAETAESVQ